MNLIQELKSLPLQDFLTKLEQEKNEERAQALLFCRCATDKELFALAYFPHYCQHEFNELHRDLFTSDSFMSRSIRRARAAPRGYAKSTLEALIEPIHDVCYQLEKFIVIFSNTEGQAYQKLGDIRTEVLTNTRLATDYGLHFKKKTPGQGNYVVYARNFSCMFQGYGAGTEVRGIRFGSHRPTKIIVDDGEHSEEVLNEAIRRKYEDWAFQVVSKLGTKETNIKWIGTILHSESLLAGLIKNPAYDGKIYKAVISWSNRQDLWDVWTKIYTDLDKDNRKEEANLFYDKNKKDMLDGVHVLWPEKESYLDLVKELIETGRRAFFKEKQNEPVGGDDALFDKFHWYRETSDGLLILEKDILIPWKELKSPDGKWLNMYGVIDPAAGQTKPKPGKLGDYACLLSGIKERKGRLFVHHDVTKRLSPTKQIEECFELDQEFDYQKFGVETNLFRSLMMENLEAERKRVELRLKKHIRVPFYDIENFENKEKRINTLEPKVTHGHILFNVSLSETFKRQLEAYPHVDHDDGPDALEMLWGLVNNRYKSSAISMNPSGGR